MVSFCHINKIRRILGRMWGGYCCQEYYYLFAPMSICSTSPLYALKLCCQILSYAQLLVRGVEPEAVHASIALRLPAAWHTPSRLRVMYVIPLAMA